MDKHITTLAEKLESYIYVNPETKCWDWMGCISGGRGQVRWDGKMRLATRAMMVVKKRVDPDGKPFSFDSRYNILHSCHNPRCVRPEHLRVGTQSENMHDRQQAGRAPDLRGEKHPQCKLSDADVEVVLQLLKEDMPQRKIAKLFGVSQSQICLINTGKSRSNNDRS